MEVDGFFFFCVCLVLSDLNNLARACSREVVDATGEGGFSGGLSNVARVPFTLLTMARSVSTPAQGQHAIGIDEGTKPMRRASTYTPRKLTRLTACQMLFTVLKQMLVRSIHIAIGKTDGVHVLQKPMKAQGASLFFCPPTKCH
eukprot:GHVT01023101.1.p1 GENE.GHVT01023101.1~~GHVT01023101.1.p1  ORF type:complete len:144 (+),score=5.83 GHVT01023101.1:1317-1748(+)